MSGQAGGAREAILGAIRQSLGRGPLRREAAAKLEARLGRGKPNLIPARGQIPHDQQVDLFVSMAEEASATVKRVATGAGVPGAVAEFLTSHNLPPELVMAPDPELDAYPWDKEAMLKIRRGKAEEPDAVSVTAAFAGVAESGTLMLNSGPESPTTLNFLPENHIVILGSKRIIGAYEEGWAMLRARGRARRPDGAFMPRTVNFITGPSRTADIEQKMQLGAHGPRRLHIILVEGEEG